MEARHKIKAREKGLARDDDTSSDADDLSDFEDVQLNAADLAKKDEEDKGKRKFFFTPEDLS